MSDEENQEIPMAECGKCRTIIPLDSKSCSNCGVNFGGVSEESLGECGSCGKLQPTDSQKCIQCGVSFVENNDSDEEDTPESSTEEEPETTSAESDEIDDTDTEETDVEVETEEADAEVEAEETDVEVEVEDDKVSEDDVEESEELADESQDEEPEEDSNDDVDEAEEDVSEESTEDTDDAEESEPSEDEDTTEEADDAEEEEVDNNATVMAFESLAFAIAEAGFTAAEAFAEMDASEDNLIDAPELQKGIEKIGGEKLSPSEVTAILQYLDTNKDNRIDPSELVKALDDLKIGIKPGVMPKVKKEKEFPSPVQKFLMGKKANDIFYPIAYFLMVAFIGCWVVNGIGLIVSGDGGTIVYDGHDDGIGEVDFANWNVCELDLDEMPDPCYGSVDKGETYPCDPAIDPGKCANSLTPFSGENGGSSMPAGFYTDGIVMIIIGVMGLAVIAYLHLVYAPSLRDLVKGDSPEKSDEEDQSDDSDSAAEDDDEDDSDDDEDDSDDDEDDSDDDEDDSDDDEDDSDDDEDADEDDIDVGSSVGLDVDGEEFFGIIIKFDDDEGTVTIETEDGEEITGDEDDMFLDDEDDDE
jgi:hypothetical protein